MGKNLSIYLDEETIQQLNDLAKAQCRSRNEIILFAIEAFLKKHKREEVKK